jgi:hypothetical protein
LLLSIAWDLVAKWSTGAGVGEIGKRGDNRFNGVKSDCRRMNIRAVIKRGYFWT